MCASETGEKRPSYQAIKSSLSSLHTAMTYLCTLVYLGVCLHSVVYLWECNTTWNLLLLPCKTHTHTVRVFKKNSHDLYKCVKLVTRSREHPAAQTLKSRTSVINKKDFHLFLVNHLFSAHLQLHQSLTLWASFFLPYFNFLLWLICRMTDASPSWIRWILTRLSASRWTMNFDDWFNRSLPKYVAPWCNATKA